METGVARSLVDRKRAQPTTTTAIVASSHPVANEVRKRDSCGRALGTGPIVNARRPGDLLDGRYELAERIGSGGMGTVHRARDLRLDRVVAVKLLHHGREVDDVTRARLRAEARFAGALQHPGIVQVFDYGEEPGEDGPTPYVVMQFVEGRPVSEVLRERGALPAETVAALLVDLADALLVAHAVGIVHRDLKPSNILLTASGRAVLVDFGVARSDSTEPLTETGQIVGSADYLSPEQVRGQRATPASDIYALGIVAHQCLSAISPFRRETQAATLLARLHDEPPELGLDVPAPMRSLVSRMMAAEPADRPTAGEVALLAANLDQDASPEPSAKRARPWDRRRLAAIVAAAALLLTIGTVLVIVHGDEATPPASAADLVVPSVRGEQLAQADRGPRGGRLPRRTPSRRRAVRARAGAASVTRSWHLRRQGPGDGRPPGVVRLGRAGQRQPHGHHVRRVRADPEAARSAPLTHSPADVDRCRDGGRDQSRGPGPRRLHGRADGRCRTHHDRTCHHEGGLQGEVDQPRVDEAEAHEARQTRQEEALTPAQPAGPRARTSTPRGDDGPDSCGSGPGAPHSDASPPLGATWSH